MGAFVHQVVTVFIAPHFDSWVVKTYAQEERIDRLLGVYRNSNGSRNLNTIDPLGAWDILERSRFTHVSISDLLAANADREEFNGLARRNGTRWAQLEFHIYCELQRSIFERSRKFNLAAEPSTYQGRKL